MRGAVDERDPTVGSRLREGDRRFFAWLVGAMVLGLAVRLAYIYGLKWDVGPAGDPAYYHFQANALVEGLGFVDPWSWAVRQTGVRGGAEHPPLFSLFLAIPSSLGFDTFRQHVIASGILGTLTCGMIGIAGRAVAGARVGIIAAFVAAIYANLFFNDGLALSESITAFTVAFVVWFAYRFWRDPTMRNVALLGLACGFAALTRVEVALFLPIGAIPLALRAPALLRPEKLKRVAVLVLMAAIPIAPWVGYNLSRFEEPVFLSTGGDFTVGNTYCPSTFSGDRLGWWDNSCMANRWAIPGDESQVAAHFREDGLEYLKDNLERLPVVLAARVGRMWGVYRPFRTMDFDSFEGRKPNEAVRVASAQYYVLAILAVAGLVLLRRRRITILPLVGLLVASTFGAMASSGITRYRVAAEVALVIAGAVAIAHLSQRWFPSRPDAGSPDAGSPDVGSGELPGGAPQEADASAS